MRAFTRRNIIAIAVGASVAGLPLLAFDFWLNRLIDQQGQEEVDTSAQRAIALAENRVNQVLSTLDTLAERGVDNCAPSNLEAMRQAAFDTMPIKEVAVLGPDGQTLCTHLGLPLGERRLLTSEPLAGAPGYRLDVIELPNEEHGVRLHRKVSGGPNEIAALVPAALFLPQVSSRGRTFSAYARIVTKMGGRIGQLGEPAEDEGARVFAAKASSDRFGFSVQIAMPRDGAAANNAGIERLGAFAAAGAGMIILAFALLRPRRSADNPVAELERALAAGEFVPYYQPVVDIRSGQLRGAEVLVRWKKPDGSLVLPGSFIPLAESSGMIHAMTRDLMRRVCAEVGPALGRRPALKISFNFAGKLFSDPSIVKDVRTIFSGSAIKLSQVVLELTERDPIENFTETRQIIAGLQGLGVRIAIDDVGSGHAGLSYMLKLGVDIIKIDKMFVDAISTDRNSITIVETLIDLAHNMRMDVVAEGVENFEQVIHLRELGIRSAQGYVFAPPLPGSSFLKLVEAIDPLGAAEPAAVQAPAGKVAAA